MFTPFPIVDMLYLSTLNPGGVGGISKPYCAAKSSGEGGETSFWVFSCSAISPVLRNGALLAILSDSDGYCSVTRFQLPVVARVSVSGQG
jgi:hypothetical protein